MSASSRELDEEAEEGLLSGAHKSSVHHLATPRLGRVLKKMLPTALIIGFLVFLMAPPDHSKTHSDEHFLENGPHEWAQYSPYTPQANYTLPPSGCQINQVHIRHGARYPTSGATDRIMRAVWKLLSVKEYKDPRFKFLKGFSYDLGVDDLVPFGADQSFKAGEEAFMRYSYLIGLDSLPFVRASSAERVVISALNWTSGFAAASEYIFQPSLSVVLSEAANDTLDDKMCPSAGSSDAQTSVWLAQYAPPVTKHLNDAAPGANLTDVDTFSLMSLCPFESVAKRRKSEFCTIFESQTGAFPGFSYSGDLDKYYGTGYGEPLGPVQGVGYVNELLARLTSKPVEDHTQTNHTLDSSPETFPLNRTLYADFSHDNAMIAIFSAMGLFKQPAVEPLDPSKPHDARVWRVGAIVPFSGRMVVERLACDTSTMVRILVNDKVQPLELCGASGDGLCTLDAFVSSQAYARNGSDADWASCRLEA
ncbi:hypothetical protein EIP86_006703 [Pleurotus ostreatoroseus]|nr:hypothetical protein EIP86_006703 [Pleurotus ostreatoroseus]